MWYKISTKVEKAMPAVHGNSRRRTAKPGETSETQGFCGMNTEE